MSAQFDTPFRTFSFASAISAFTLVKVSGDSAAAVAANGLAVGIVQEDVAAAGIGMVKLFHPTYFATVSGSVVAGGVCHALSDGKIASAGGVSFGIAINAGSTGEIVEIAVPLSPPAAVFA